MNDTVAVVFCSVENRTPIGRNGADGGSGLIERVVLGGAGGGAITSGVSGGDAGCNGQTGVGLKVGAGDVDREDLAVAALGDGTGEVRAINGDGDDVAHRHITADGSKPYPGIKNLLKKLQKNYKLAVCSNKLEKLFSYLKIMELFIIKTFGIFL